MKSDRAATPRPPRELRLHEEELLDLFGRHPPEGDGGKGGPQVYAVDVSFLS